MLEDSEVKKQDTTIKKKMSEKIRRVKDQTAKDKTQEKELIVRR